MSNNDKKWASNKKDQLLVENFRNFMKEGLFGGPDMSLLALRSDYAKKAAREINADLLDYSDPERFVRKLRGRTVLGNEASDEADLGNTEGLAQAFEDETYSHEEKMQTTRKWLNNLYTTVTDDWDPIAAKGAEDDYGIARNIDYVDKVLKKLDKFMKTGSRPQEME